MKNGADIKKCRICNNNTIVLNSDNGLKFHKCLSCSFTQKNHVHFISDQEQRNRYLKHNNEISDNTYCNMMENIIDIKLSPFIRSDMKYILDFGCGQNSAVNAVLSGQGFKVVSYDKFFHNDPDALKRPYDIIIAVEVFEHLLDPLKWFKRLSSLLNDKSILFIQTLLRPEKDNDFVNWWYTNDTTHISFFSLSSIKHMASLVQIPLYEHDSEKSLVFLSP